MAIYSCNLKSIGRTTHAPGTAGAHIRYISRPEAQPVLIAEHMPTEGGPARAWADTRERALRKNARVIDKIRIALPKELDEDQRAASQAELGVDDELSDRAGAVDLVTVQGGGDEERVFL